MKLAIMQPYFFPYIGYWQLISAVDTFVIYDDVNYVKKGYINRNQILVNNASHLMTLELVGASQNKRINEVVVGGNLTKIWKTIELAYKKAPYFKEVSPLLRDILKNKESDLVGFLVFLIRGVCDYLDITMDVFLSSELEKNGLLKGQDKILDICGLLQAEQYINAIGGQELYQKEVFSHKNIDLSFIRSKSIDYKQFREPFIPNLSIIDVLMFNDKEQVKQYLTEFELV